MASSTNPDGPGSKNHARVDLRGQEAFEGVIRAAWLDTGAEVLQDAGLQVSGGRVEAITHRAADPVDAGGQRVLAFPGGLLHAGLVNAHAHLDLSGLAGRVPPRADFTGWLEAVRSRRLADERADLTGVVRRGLEEMVAAGMTGLIDFSPPGPATLTLADTPLRSIVLLELIGLEAGRAAAALARAREWLAAETAGASRQARGLAPHAPYSASGELIRGAAELAAGRPLAIHVAEDPGETELLVSGSGPFRAFLRRLGIPGSAVPGPGQGPIRRLEELGVLRPATLLVHANHLDGEDRELVARSGASVVFCPGTHVFFGRPPHPLPDLVARGIPVALGTDSAASNSELSVLEEMRRVRRLFPELPARTIFDLGTGRQLGRFFPGAGEIRVGGPADLAVTDLGPGEPGRSPLEAVLEGRGANLLTLAAGRVLHRSR